MEYSIIIPAHNEAENIELFVADFIQRLPDLVRNVLREVIIVENGSNDGTLKACHRLHDRFPGMIRVISNKRGSYGEAIKRGMLESQGTHLTILECDFLDVNFVSSSIDLFNEGNAKFAVASKRHPRSQDKRSFKRRMLTMIFNRILNTFTGYPGTDTHGLKSIETELATRLCVQALTTDEIFQTELVMLAWRQGVRIHELPVNIREVRSTPVSILKRFPMVLDTIRQLRKSLRRFPEATQPEH
jgi:glycosyltransferase involved in cell wall biosynthesis